jgi:hypothetical protein
LDIYIFSASVAGTFYFKLRRMNLMCSTAADMPGWHMSLRDQDSNELAYTSVDGLGDHSFAAYLDAGVPYYVSVTAADAVAGGEYQLSIISD